MYIQINTETHIPIQICTHIYMYLHILCIYIYTYIHILYICRVNSTLLQIPVPTDSHPYAMLAVSCSELQCVAVCCSLFVTRFPPLRHDTCNRFPSLALSAVPRRSQLYPLQLTATHCNTAIHCVTLATDSRLLLCQQRPGGANHVG